jgi:hypothetical protein
VITQPNNIPTQKPETSALASLITELNIARRNSSAYPKGHPVIAASLAKVLHIYENLVHEHDEIILGVTNETLMVNGVVLEKSNLVYKNFSRVLFERGIGALLFHIGITVEELNDFIAILVLKREYIQQSGGIEQLWATAGITAMTIRPLRYDLFTSIDQDSITVGQSGNQADQLWNTFTQELTRGALILVDDGEYDCAPEVLANILNQKFADGIMDESEVRAAISCFFENETGNTSPDLHSSSSDSPDPYKKLADFISSLTPELRRQFLNSTFNAMNPERQTAAEHMLNSLSEEVIIEALDDISHDRLSISPVVFGLLQRLGANAGSSQHRFEEETEDSEIVHKMKTILREHASEEFVPDSYQRKLNKIITSDHLLNRNMEDVSSLLTTMENRSIEGSIGHILMNLIRESLESPEERDMLLQNLTDMFGFFLQTGDYDQLLTMIDQLTDGTFPIEIQYRLREEYGRREFLEEILDGLTIWGKSIYGDIRALITKIGGPFIETILDRLSEEKNMSIRRFYMDCLIDMGPVTRIPIRCRLDDTRWYFLRNLLIILCAQNDPSSIDRIRALLRSEEPRLRLEALKTLVHFRDPQAEQLLMNNLNSQNQEIQVAAIQLAERCASSAITALLAQMLVQGGYSHSECERKSAIVHTLGEIGRTEVLPELAKVLRSRSLFHSKHLTRLKSDIIRSLPKYPVHFSRPVLELIAKDSGEIARLAQETLRIISGIPYE